MDTSEIFDVRYFKIQRKNDYIIYRNGGRVNLIDDTSLHFFFNYPYIKVNKSEGKDAIYVDQDHFINSFDYEVSETSIELKTIQCICPANSYEIKFYCFVLAKQAFGGSLKSSILYRRSYMLFAKTKDEKAIQVLACSKTLPIENKDIIGVYNKSLDGKSDFILLSTCLIQGISSVSTEDSPFQIDDIEKAIINSCVLPGTTSQLICNNIMHDLVVLMNENIFMLDKEGYIYSTDKYNQTKDSIERYDDKETYSKAKKLFHLKYSGLDSKILDDLKEETDMPKKQLSKEELDKIDSLSLKDNIDFSSIICHNADESNRALRYNEGKPRWGLIDYKSLLPLIRVLEYGANKYSVDNWKKGLDKREILESMQRHLASMMDGEENDKESGLPHIGHIMANAMFYSYFMNNKK